MALWCHSEFLKKIVSNFHSWYRNGLVFIFPAPQEGSNFYLVLHTTEWNDSVELVDEPSRRQPIIRSWAIILLGWCVAGTSATTIARVSLTPGPLFFGSDRYFFWTGNGNAESREECVDLEHSSDFNGWAWFAKINLHHMLQGTQNIRPKTKQSTAANGQRSLSWKPLFSTITFFLPFIYHWSWNVWCLS